MEEIRYELVSYFPCVSTRFRFSLTVVVVRRNVVVMNNLSEF